ncbi:MAG: AAA family ATPase [bacterium]|nr:AAA family ATPase [bacterium]
MGIFNDMLGSDESLFKNELALDYSFVPKVIPYRESEQRQIAACIKPLFQKRNGRNVIVFGPPGVGKTVACRHLLNEIEDETDDIVPIYVNCWQHNTTFKVFLESCNAIGYKFTQNKRSDELFAEIKRTMNKKGAVFVFDEIDKAEDFDFLYSILEDVYRKTIILITNHQEWLASLDTRIRSRLMVDALEFKSYNENETRGILKQRMEFAFVPGVWEDDAFEAVAAKTSALNDIRRGLYLMRESALAAEDKASKKITKEHVETALKKLDDFTIKDSATLDDETRFVLGIVKKNSGKKIGDVYKAYQDAGGKMVYKTFQRKITKLEKSKFISTEKVSGGAEGKTTILSYAKKEKKLTDF